MKVGEWLDCPDCRGERWVCERHPNEPAGEGSGACCGGMGMPCPTCNEHPGQLPVLPPGSTIIASVFDDDDPL